jgi:hypothetical protein
MGTSQQNPFLRSVLGYLVIIVVKNLTDFFAGKPGTTSRFLFRQIIH